MGEIQQFSKFVELLSVIFGVLVVSQCGLVEKRQYTVLDPVHCNVLAVGKALEPVQKNDIITFCNCTQAVIFKHCVEYQVVDDNYTTTEKSTTSSSRTQKTSTTPRTRNPSTSRTTTDSTTIQTDAPFFELTPPHLPILQELHVEPTRLLVSGGPPNAKQKSIDAFTLPQMTLSENSTQQMLEDIKHGLRYLFQTNNSHTLAVTGTGSTGIEVILGNLVQPGDKVLILHNGMWSEHVIDIVTRLGAVPLVLENADSVFTAVEIETQIQRQKPNLVYVVHGESSTGLYQRVDKIGEMCHRHNCITMLDVIHAVGLQPFFMDKWKIDAVVCNSHKGIGAPVGLSPMSFSSRAVAKVMNRTTPTHSRLSDFQLWTRINYWKFDPTRPLGLHHSIPVLLLYTLRTALGQLSREGLSHSWRNHAAVDAYFRKRLAQEFPFLEDWVKEPSHRLLGAVMIKFPLGRVNSTEARNYILVKHAIDISDGIGASKGHALRVALIAKNANFESADKVIEALRDTFSHFKLSTSRK